MNNKYNKYKVLNQDAIKYIAMNKWIFYCFYPIHFLILKIFA